MNYFTIANRLQNYKIKFNYQNYFTKMSKLYLNCANVHCVIQQRRDPSLLSNGCPNHCRFFKLNYDNVTFVPGMQMSIPFID